MDYALAFVALLAACIGGGLGHALRRREDADALEQLGAENRQLRKRLVLVFRRRHRPILHVLSAAKNQKPVTLCRYREREHVVKGLQRYINRGLYPDSQLIIDEHLAQPQPVNDRYANAILRHSGSLS